MTKLLLQSQTRIHIERFISKPTHALLLVGPEGAGKKYIADYLASILLELPAEKLGASPYVLHVSTASGSVGIEQIRQLTNFLLLKTTGHRPVRRVVIIHDLNKMTTEAQNALLKSLEEPPSDTVFLLTAALTNNIKATILSRSQMIVIKPASMDEAISYFADKGLHPAKIEKNYVLSEGNVGLLKSLLTNESGHPLLSAIAAAKEFLSSPPFVRLSSVAFNQNKAELDIFIESLSRVCHAASQTAASKNSATLKDWHRRLNTVYEARESLSANANPKLVLTHLALAL